ncbi:hypothetical protein SAMN05216267_102566 [Actinacidiphila rubida]|uniref:Uncharacterized protein n=1 Tax=Actinacidiphila rubida TaxID=310780 RepID=A0A1H8PDA3_9ACTN|nr:hypothetical protein SAMN05216267_102566 [Actinacidiphila rubida]
MTSTDTRSDGHSPYPGRAFAAARPAGPAATLRGVSRARYCMLGNPPLPWLRSSE